MIPPVTGCLVIDAIANPEELPDDGLNILAEGTFNSSMDAFELKLAPDIINGPRREVRDCEERSDELLIQ